MIIIILFLLIIILLCYPYIKKEKLTNTINTNISSETDIPNTIYRTHKEKDVPKIMKTYCNDLWVELNPEYSMIWFDDKECNDYMKTMGPRIYNSYDKLIPGAYKADLFRACILYNNGGVYVDSYTQPFTSLQNMFKNYLTEYKDSKHKFISAKDKEGCGIHNGFIASTPNHPFLKQYIDDIVHNCENNYYGKDSLEPTGPICLEKSIKKIYNDKLNIGINHDENVPFLLFSHPGFQWSMIMYPVYRDGKLIMNKKYSVIELFKQRYINKNTTYGNLWLNKKIYKN